MTVAAQQDNYQKACGIADLLLSRGYPVSSYEARGGMIIIRFGGERAQTIHAEADSANFDAFAQAYDTPPPPELPGAA